MDGLGRDCEGMVNEDGSSFFDDRDIFVGLGGLMNESGL